MIKKLIGYLIDVAGLCGAALVVYGIAQFHPPSAYIVAGLAITTLAIMRAKRCQDS